MRRSSLLALAAAGSVGAVSVPFTRRATGGDFRVKGAVVPSLQSMVAVGTSSSALVSKMDLLYSANVTIGSRVFAVQLDTGSSDLWVKADADVTTFGATHFGLPSLNLSYGVGSAAGIPSSAPVTFGPYTIPAQAFLDVTTADMAALFAKDVHGILGLGFNSASVLQSVFAQTGTPARGLSLLENVFLSQPGQPNFIAFYLGRTGDLEEISPGSFAIGEVPPQYAAVTTAASLPVFVNPNPQSLPRWTVSVDAVELAGANLTITSAVKDAPSGKPLALLDTGTSLALLPASAVTAIYSSIPGAVFDSDIGYWLVPCSASAHVAFWLGGQRFLVHPLDLTIVTGVQLGDGTSVTVCVNAFMPNSQTTEFDFLLGDSFLRNAFQVYDFGDTDASGNAAPYVKLLSITNQTTVDQDFVVSRKQALSQLPPELDLSNSAIMASAKSAVTKSSAKDAASAPSAAVSSSPSAAATHHASHKVGFHGSHKQNNSTKVKQTGAGKPIVALAADNDASSSTSTSISDQVQKLLDFSPLILGLLGANVALGLVLCGLGVFICRQNRKRKQRTGDVPLKTYQPVRTTEDQAPPTPGAYRDASPEPSVKRAPVNEEDGPGGYRDSGVFVGDLPRPSAPGMRNSVAGPSPRNSSYDAMGPLEPPSAPALRGGMGGSPRNSTHESMRGSVYDAGAARMSTYSALADAAEAPANRSTSSLVPPSPRGSGFAPPVAPSPFADDATQHRMSATHVPLPRSAAPSPVPLAPPMMEPGTPRSAEFHTPRSGEFPPSASLAVPPAPVFRGQEPGAAGGYPADDPRRRPSSMLPPPRMAAANSPYRSSFAG